jgi:signal transduction histidine kinase
MEQVTQIKVATITLWNFAAVLINVIAFFILYMKANHNASLKAFFLVQFSMMIWLVGKVFKTVSPTASLRWAFIVMYYFGICLLAASFLDFAYIYNKGRALKKPIRISIYMIALTQFIIVLTNPYHYLFYSEYSFWSDEFGILFYFQLGFNYIFILIGLVLCSRQFKTHLKERKKVARRIISFAILAPIVLNFIYITRLLEKIFDKLQIQIFDITPIVYTWSILIFVYATYKYEFFDLTPIMKYEIATRLDTPILILDKTGNGLYANRQLEECFDALDNYENVERMIEKYGFYKKGIQPDQIISYKDRYYKCDIGELKELGATKYIVTFNDITSYQIARNELYRENEELQKANDQLEYQIEMLKQTSCIGARNYVARELHDIMGHSLVVTMKLLEVAKISFRKSKDRAYESLEKSKYSIINGFQEMKALKDRDNSINYNTTFLERELKRMLKEIEGSGIDVNFYFRSKRECIDEKIFDILKKISTELVTNTLKHAKASKILLSIDFNGMHINIKMMDNGIGVSEIIKGNGLKGIESRLALVRGEVKYISREGEGFVCNIVIPK